MYRLLLGLLLAVFLTGTATADIEAVRGMLERGDAKSAVDQLRPLAEKGTAEAQNLLGDLFFTGRGTYQNLSMAFGWHAIRVERGGRCLTSAFAN